MRFLVIRARTVALCGMLAILLAGAGIYYNVQHAASAFSPWSADYTLVIDAGHGGFDGGAVGAGGTTEQHINLSVAKRTQALAGLFGIDTVMTREDEDALGYEAGKSVHDNKIADIKSRERITKDAVNPVFLSVHLNKFEDGKYWGAQTFYSKNAPAGKILAEELQKNLIAGLNPENHRQAKQAVDTIYLMKRLDCPAVIVECGFLSNAEEELLLQQEDYHKRLSICIMSGYLAFLSGESA